MYILLYVCGELRQLAECKRQECVGAARHTAYAVPMGKGVCMCWHILISLRRCRMPHLQCLCSPKCHAASGQPPQAYKNISPAFGRRYDSTQGLAGGTDLSAPKAIDYM